MSRRYDLCDATCTTDCGHCKGDGPPASAVSAALPVVHNPWDSSCVKHLTGEPSRPADHCFACHP